jgi:hypothetical protein
MKFEVLILLLVFIFVKPKKESPFTLVAERILPVWASRVWQVLRLADKRLLGLNRVLAKVGPHEFAMGGTGGWIYLVSMSFTSHKNRACTHTEKEEHVLLDKFVPEITTLVLLLKQAPSWKDCCIAVKSSVPQGMFVCSWWRGWVVGRIAMILRMIGGV